MKTERRHELKHNELADQLAKWGESVQPYSRMILGGVILVIVAIFAGAFMAKKSAEKNAEGWQQYFDSFNKFDAEALSENAKKYNGTSAGQWSSLMAGEILLSHGIQQLFSDKAAARTKLQEAVDRYQSVLLNSNEPVVRERAIFGLARAYESRGELPKAAEQYAELIKSFPNGMFVETARNRLKDVESSSTKQFYDWFAEYQPPRASKGLSGKPGERPSDFLDDLPDAPNFGLPSVITDKPPATGKDEPAEDDSKTGDAKTGDDKPADGDKPAESPEPAADDEKPAAVPDEPAVLDESPAPDDAKPATDDAESPASPSKK